MPDEKMLDYFSLSLAIDLTVLPPTLLPLEYWTYFRGKLHYWSRFLNQFYEGFS